jgi:hypothetical protein
VDVYVSDSSMHLMKGPSHFGPRETRRDENVEAHCRVDHIDGGGW